MLIACVVGLCVLLFVGALVAPRMSRGPEGAADGASGAGTRRSSSRPGRFRRWLRAPFPNGRSSRIRTRLTGDRAPRGHTRRAARGQKMVQIIAGALVAAGLLGAAYQLSRSRAGAAGNGSSPADIERADQRAQAREAAL